jgi:hypothetical protein
LELTKRISLRQLDAAALLELRETGSCEFRVPEVAFDLDHPGHYFRRLKAVSLSIPAVAGPHVSVGTTLTLLQQTIRSEPTANANGSDYPWTDDGSGSDPRFIDDAVGVPQAIATSGGQGGAGVFELSFRDDKYLPFEGAGAVSRWRIELPTVRQFDYRTIADVEVELRYTARDGGSTLREAATHALEDAIEAVFDAANHTGLLTVLSATKDFATGWERLLRPAEGQEGDPLVIPIVLDRFPYVARSRGIEIDAVQLVFIGEPAALSLPAPVTVQTPQGATTVSFSTVDGLLQGSVDDSPPLFPLTLDQNGGSWSLEVPPGSISDPDAVNDLWILVRYHVTTPTA